VRSTIKLWRWPAPPRGVDENGECVIPGFVKMSVVNRPATEARTGVNPFTKQPMEYAAKPAGKTVKAFPLKAAKDAVFQLKGWVLATPHRRQR
jgi:hypothetical protein